MQILFFVLFIFAVFTGVKILGKTYEGLGSLFWGYTVLYYLVWGGFRFLKLRKSSEEYKDEESSTFLIALSNATLYYSYSLAIIFFLTLTFQGHELLGAAVAIAIVSISTIIKMVISGEDIYKQ